MLVGDPVAFVVAESVDLAKDAAERIAVDYEPLPSVTATEEALLPAAPKLWAILAAVLAYSVIATQPSLILFLLFFSYSLSGYVMWATGKRLKSVLPDE